MALLAMERLGNQRCLECKRSVLVLVFLLASLTFILSLVPSASGWSNEPDNVEKTYWASLGPVKLRAQGLSISATTYASLHSYIISTDTGRVQADWDSSVCQAMQGIDIYCDLCDTYSYVVAITTSLASLMFFTATFCSFLRLTKDGGVVRLFVIIGSLLGTLFSLMSILYWGLGCYDQLPTSFGDTMPSAELSLGPSSACVISNVVFGLLVTLASFLVPVRKVDVFGAYYAAGAVYNPAFGPPGQVPPPNFVVAGGLVPSPQAPPPAVAHPVPVYTPPTPQGANLSQGEGEARDTLVQKS